MKNKNFKEIIKLALDNGYDYAVNDGYWNGFEVYTPIFWDDIEHIIGYPNIILSKDNEVRWTTNEECFKVIDEMEKYSFEREIENIPAELESGLTIKSFKFERGGHFGNYQTFEFKALKKGKILSYTEVGEYDLTLLPGKTEITDEKFDEYALGMIKYFHEDFGTNPYVRDGEWFEFKATLSDGQKLKSSGYNYFPYNYNKFILYLEHFMI